MLWHLVRIHGISKLCKPTRAKTWAILSQARDERNWGCSVARVRVKERERERENSSHRSTRRKLNTDTRNRKLAINCKSARRKCFVPVPFRLCLLRVIATTWSDDNFFLFLEKTCRLVSSPSTTSTNRAWWEQSHQTFIHYSKKLAPTGFFDA